VSALFSLEGRVALVTGASAGLGAGIALALAEAGADVVCHGNTRPPEATSEAIAQLGRQSLPVRGDLADRATPQFLIDATLERFGKLDILVNNAGTIRRAPAVDFAEDDWDTILEVNLTSVFRLSQLAGRHLLERGEGGKIVNYRVSAHVSGRHYGSCLCRLERGRSVS
jgi:2-deoxy-D-gluconate 3-dehydrogenase